MRKELLKELRESIESKMGIMSYKDAIFTAYPDEDDEDEDGFYEPEEVFNKNNVIAIIEWEIGNVFISGLTDEEIHYLSAITTKGGK